MATPASHTPASSAPTVSNTSLPSPRSAWPATLVALAVAAFGSVLSPGIPWSPLKAAPAAGSEGSTATAGLPRPAMGAVKARPRDSGLDPHWMHGAFMEIFVRAYQDSNGDGVGDLKGVTARLDHLQRLGVRGIWLMPITRSADRDHGYATADYRSIEPDYGTQADLRELLAQAHRRGIGVIMDYVVNHSAHTFAPFQQALAQPTGPYRDWFLWSEDRPAGWDIWGKHPWYHTASEPWKWTGEVKDMPAPPAGAKGFYFGTFGPHMPDFNLRHPAAWRYHLDSLRHWMNLGLDGVRLDAVPHMVENGPEAWNDQAESRALTQELQAVVKRYPKRYTVCEATSGAEDYATEGICGAAFAFHLTRHLVQAPKGGATGAASVQAIVDDWSRGHRGQAAPATMATFLSNHDIFAGPRVWDQFQGDTVQYRLAAATYLLMPGTPFIYYGEELGQAGLPGLPGDGPIRGRMDWSGLERQAADPQSILSFYQQALGLRNGHAALSRGRWENGFADGSVLGFQRVLETPAGQEKVLVLLHYGTKDRTVALPGLSGQPQLLWSTGARLTAATEPARWNPQAQALPAQSVQVWKWTEPKH